MSGNLRKKGSLGEDSAAAFLVSQKISIIEKNYFAGRIGEIDIIARKDNCVIFVEVKSRNSNVFGGGLFSLNKKKIQNLKKAGLYYITKNPQYDKNFTFRFDLIIIKNGEISWVKDIVR